MKEYRKPAIAVIKINDDVILTSGEQQQFGGQGEDYTDNNFWGGNN